MSYNILIIIAVDCLDSTCSQHGDCVLGKCVCHAGWTGQSCK